MILSEISSCSVQEIKQHEHEYAEYRQSNNEAKVLTGDIAKYDQMGVRFEAAIRRLVSANAVKTGIPLRPRSTVPKILTR